MNKIEKLQHQNMVVKMNSELEEYLRHEIEDIKKKISSFAKDIYGEELRFDSLQLREEIVSHFNGAKEKIIELYVDTDKGYFRVRKSYPVSSEETSNV